MIRFFTRLFMVLSLLFCAVPASAQTFQIEGVAFESSDYLTDELLNSVSAKYISRPITFDDLQAMIDELNLLYARSGVPTARAVLPPQEIRDGILRVSLIEAEIEIVEVEGFRNTNPDFLRRTISLGVGTKPDFAQLERDLMIYDIAHDISPQLSFSAGDTPGTTRAIIRAEEPERWSITGSLDNFGRPETGEARATAFVRWNSATGVRDTLSFQAQGSSGAQSTSVGYSRPIGPGGGRVVAALSYSTSSIIGGDFTVVRIKSDSASASLSYRRPAWVRPDRYVMFDGGLTYETTQSTIEETDFADINLSDLFFSARYNRRYAKAVLGVSAGLRAGTADAIGTSETEGSYWLLYGEGTYARPLSEKLMFNGTLRYQLAYGENLPVARLLTAGGVGTVRGYPENIRGGDSGVVLNFQLSARDPITPEAMPKLRMTPFGFVDAALILPYRVDGGFNSEHDLLASLGGGVSFGLGDKASLLAMIGVPLVDTLGFTDAGQPAFYLGLDYTF